MAISLETLKRYPLRKKELLQAWDQADVLILEHLRGLDLSEKRVLILNDSFGALTTQIQAKEVSAYTDSFVAAKACELNSDGTRIPFATLENLQGVYDVVVFKLPKNLSFWEDELCHLSAHLNTDSVLIGGAMVKHLPSGAFTLIDRYMGKVTTSLAQKKARLLFAKFEKSPVVSPYPLSVAIAGFQKPFRNDSNLFSREKLDMGTRFFLEHLPKPVSGTILDLGCANGIVGIAAKLQNPAAKLVFTDESAMAIASARENYGRYFFDTADFEWTNGYENGAKESVDVVLCNPPFHQQSTVGDFIALQMFHDSFHALKQGGSLYVIGNAHLGYPARLKGIFGNAQVLATQPKFVVVKAVKNS